MAGGEDIYNIYGEYTVCHIQKKNILTRTNQIQVIMAVYWEQGCATYMCTATPKAQPPPPPPLIVSGCLR